MVLDFIRKEVWFWKRNQRVEAERKMREEQERIFHEGAMKGEKRGELRGEKRGERKALAAHCLSLGYSVSEIASITGLEEEAIRTLGM